MLFFGKKKRIEEAHQKIDEMNGYISASFQRVKEDMVNIHKWLLNFKESHNEHYSNNDYLLHKIKKLENKIDEVLELKDSVKHKRKKELPYKSQFDSAWETLTETQKIICWKLAALQKETPNEWVSLKYLGQEVYPDRSYDQIRSALSQFVSVLEDLGYVVRKRKGKQAYVYSTEKNPAMHQKLNILIKARR